MASRAAVAALLMRAAQAARQRGAALALPSHSNDPFFPLSTQGSLALRDPPFGWRLAKFCVESGLSLDESVVPPVIMRAYRYLLEPGQVNVSMARAEALNLPEK